MLFEKTIYPDDFPLNIQIIQVDEIPFHYHQDVELVYVLKGEIRLKNGYYNYLLKEGDIFTNSGHEVHGLRATDSDNVIAVIQISNRFFTQYFPQLPKACFRTYVNDDRYAAWKICVACCFISCWITPAKALITKAPVSIR